MTAQDLGCETLDFSDFPITVTAPAAVGTYTTDVYVSFNDPDSSDFVSVSGGVKVEIISIGNRVVGKILASSISTDNTINGTFDIAVCE